LAIIYGIHAKRDGEIMSLTHLERSEESVVPGNIGCLQILRSAKNAELRMTKSPLIFEGIQFMNNPGIKLLP
jgi:hypothetical protein